MKRLLFTLALLSCLALAADKPQGPVLRPQGMYLNTATDQPLSLYGVEPIVQRSGANQTALTDSTGGSVSNATLADGLTATAPAALTATAPAAATAAALTGTLTGITDGALADVADIALSTLDTYSDAAVNSAVNAAILATNLQLKELQTQVNALVADNADLRTKLAASVVDLAALRTPLAAAVTDDSTQNDNDAKLAELVNELRAALVALGAIAGS